MRLFLLAMAVLVLTGIGAHFLHENPGYVMVAFGDTRVELTLWTAIGLVVLAIALLYLLILLLLAPFKGWAKGRRLWQGHQVRAHEQQATNGLIAYIEGHWEKARKILSQLAGQKESPLLYNLLSARASHALGDAQGAEKYLRAAEESSSKADFAVGLTQAEMQVDRGQLEGALATLMRVRAVSSSHPAALKLLAQVYEGLGDWPQLRKLLPELHKAHVYDSEELLQLERKVYAASLVEASKSGGVTGLEKAWKHLPRSLARDSALSEVYVEQLVAQGEEQRAELFLQQSLSHSWDENLVPWYGKVSGGDSQSQLAKVEGWLKARGDSAALLLAAGRLALANRQWGKAQGYFEESLKKDKNPDAYAELGRLLSSLGEVDTSNDYLRQGLMASTGNLPDLPLPLPKKVVVPPPALATAEVAGDSKDTSAVV